MAEKDITSKTIESFNDVFADIVNGFLFDGEKVISPDELTPADIFSQYKADGKSADKNVMFQNTGRMRISNLLL